MIMKRIQYTAKKPLKNAENRVVENWTYCWKRGFFFTTYHFLSIKDAITSSDTVWIRFWQVSVKLREARRFVTSTIIALNLFISMKNITNHRLRLSKSITYPSSLALSRKSQTLRWLTSDKWLSRYSIPPTCCQLKLTFVYPFVSLPVFHQSCLSMCWKSSSERVQSFWLAILWRVLERTFCGVQLLPGRKVW